jgi:ankyrin repeat protein
MKIIDEIDNAISTNNYVGIFNLVINNLLTMDEINYGFSNSCRIGNKKMVNLFLDLGADINTFNGISIIWACKYKHIEIIPIILNAGADISCDNYQCIKVAIENNLINTVYDLFDYCRHEILLENLTEFIEVSIVANNFVLINYWTGCGGNLFNAFKKYIENNNSYNFNTIKFIIEQGVNPHFDNYTLLKYSVRSGDFNLMKLLLENGADMQKISYLEFRDLVKTEQIKSIIYLLESGYVIDDNKLLMILVVKNNVNLINVLMKYGLDIFEYGDEAIYHCINFDYCECLNFLLKNGININNLNLNKIESTCKNKLSSINLLKSYGLQFDVTP